MKRKSNGLKTKGDVNGPVLEYTLTPEELEKYRSMRIIAEIGEDNYEYIINHHGKQKRNVIAKKTGILKFNLNQYFIDLFGSEAM